MPAQIAKHYLLNPITGEVRLVNSRETLSKLRLYGWVYTTPQRRREYISTKAKSQFSLALSRRKA